MPVTAALGTSVKCKVKDGVDVHGHVKVKVKVGVNDEVERQPVSFSAPRYRRR
jgi:hypothetical protein